MKSNKHQYASFRFQCCKLILNQVLARHLLAPSPFLIQYWPKFITSHGGTWQPFNLSVKLKSKYFVSHQLSFLILEFYCIIIQLFPLPTNINPKSEITIESRTRFDRLILVFATIYLNSVVDTHNLLQWCHKESDVVSNHQPHDCLLSRLIRHHQRKHQSSVSLAFVRGIHRWLVRAPHKGQ